MPSCEFKDEKKCGEHVSLALVLAWSGKWRPWIHLFLHSCAKNPRVDFLIFTDQKPLASLPANVRMIPMTLRDVSQRASAVLGFHVCIPSAYKLCDFKPLYGLLFADHLVDYSHWGYCDEDVFWGDIRKFITDEHLRDYDLVTSCRCCVVGQLTILKNVPGVTDLICSAPHLRTQLQDDGIHLLDERVMNNLALAREREGTLHVLRRQFQTHDVNSEEWTEWANRLELQETGRVLGPLKHGDAVWCEGKLIHQESAEPFAFYHFGAWKKSWAFLRVPPPPEGIAGWKIGASGVEFILGPTAGWTERRYVLRHAAGRVVARTRKRVTARVGKLRDLGGRIWRRGWREWRKLTTVSNSPFGQSKRAG
ncbi:MAG: hypothetical protein QM760_07370 [Nibricoccus sp.]